MPGATHQEALLRAVALDAEIGTSVGLPDGGVRLLAARAQAGATATIDALARAGRTLGLAIASAVNLLAPTTVVLGGIFATLFDWLIDPLQDELTPRAFVTRYSNVAVVRSELGAVAAVRGAASLSIRAVCSDQYLLGSRSSAAARRAMISG